MKSLKIILLFLLPLSVLAQTFTASVERNTVQVGEQFKIDFILAGGDGKNFTPPDFGGLAVIAGPMQSQSVSIVNGAYSRTLTLTYYLQAKAEGTVKIGAGTMNVGGKNLQSNPITITVSKAAKSGQGNQQGDDDPANSISSKNVFLRSFASKSNIYRGESLLITYKLYTNIQLTNLNIEKMPSFNGLWSSEMEVPQPYQFKREVVDGVTYNVATIKKVVVFPQQSGAITVESMKGEVTARVQVKSKRNNNQFDPFGIFDDPFFNGGMAVKDVPVEIKSDAIKLNVKELPMNAPASFTGSVGRFTMDAFIDKPATKANEAVTLKIKISGSGNLKLIDAPKLNIPPDIETYDPKTNENISISESGASGNRTFEYLLIPRNEGNYTIEPVEFSYFDLNAKSYVSIKSKPFPLKVAKGDGSAPAAVIDAGSTNKADVAMIGKDIRFIKTNNVILGTGNHKFYGSWQFYMMLFAPAFLFIAAFAYRDRLEKLNSNKALVKSRGATKMAKKRMALADKYLKENKNEMFYDEVGKALWGYLSDKLSIPVSELSKESATAKLTEKNVKPETLFKLTSTLDMCEFARFAASAASSPQIIYSDAVNLITTVEGELG